MESIAARIAEGRTYSIATLADGALIAFDTRARTPVYVLTRSAAPDGEHPLGVSGAIVVRGGAVVGLREPASSSTRVLSQDASGKLTVRLRYSLPARTTTRVAPHLLDLRNGALMLLENGRISRLSARPARDGIYIVPLLGSLVVRGGTVADVSGQPIFQYADDFAP